MKQIVQETLHQIFECRLHFKFWFFFEANKELLLSQIVYSVIQSPLRFTYLPIIISFT